MFKFVTCELGIKHNSLCIYCLNNFSESHAEG